MKTKLLSAFVGTACLCMAGSSHAIAITADTNALSLANAVASGGGLTVISANLQGQSLAGTPAVSSGTYTNASGTYGIGPGVVLSTGNVNDYNDGPNNATNKSTDYGTSATAAQQSLLFPIDGKPSHFDVTQLDVTFTSSTGDVFFLVTFGSDEFPEFKTTTFIDAFGLYLDGTTNIAFYGGNPINVDNPAMTACPGTELDGVLPCTAPMLFSASGLSAGNHTLTFIIADSGDGIYDSTAYISKLSGENPIPEPASLALLGIGLAGLGAMRRKQRA